MPLLMQPVKLTHSQLRVVVAWKRFNRNPSFENRWKLIQAIDGRKVRKA